MSNRQKLQKIDYKKLDSGIRRYVKIIRDAGVNTIASCQGRDNPGYRPEIDGSHSGDWPYITIYGSAADAFIALGIAIYEGLPIRSIEQRWFVYPADRCVPIGPEWRITFWEKDRLK
jgi:hypothetical protein